MTKEYKYSDFNSNDNLDIDMVYSNMDISWEKSKEDIWSDMSERIKEDKAELTIDVYKSQWFKLAVAAAIFILLGITAFMRLYTKTVYCPAGSHIIADLPDGSSVHMNANSTIKYHPFWWNISRELSFSGEAYFEVEKGNKFEVVSSVGKTAVLGTCFNIYSRNKNYRVTCLTGKVSVVAKATKDKVVLISNEHAVIQKNGTIKKHKVHAADKISWIDFKFVFTSAPLRLVFEEIARQYGVKINLPESLNYTYTGNFNKQDSVEHVLDLVCLPFNFKFVKKGLSEYQIIKNTSGQIK